MSTYIQYVADGATGSFVIPFPYIDKNHVKVYVDRVVQTPGANHEVSGSTVTFLPGYQPVNGSLVEIRRETAIDGPLVSFLNGATLTAGDLNTAVRQNFYLNQEIRDLWELRLDQGLSLITGDTSATTEEMIAAITQAVLTSDVLAEFNTRIVDIDSNAESILSLQTQINSLIGASQSNAWVQPGEPVPGVAGIPDPIPEGSRWYDSDDNNKLYLYLSGAWVSVEDPRIAANDARISAVEATVNNPTTGVTATASALDLVEALVYDPGDGVVALANRIDLIGAETGDGLAFVLDTSTVRVDATTTLATKFTTLAAADDANSAAIQTIQTVTVPGLEGDIGALEARYGVKLDVNGYVSGFVQNNDGVTSDFIVLADKFAVVTPGQTPKVPFAISGGVVYMQNVVIGGALISDLTVGKLTTGTFPNGQVFNHNGDFNVGTTGRVRGGKLNFASTAPGFYLGYDATEADYVLNIGDGTRYVKWDGELMRLTGLELVDSVLNNSVLGPSAARIVTSTTGHTAPFNAYDMASYDTESSQAIYVEVGPFLAPNQGSGYDRKRVAFRKSDFIIQCNWSCNTNTVPCYVQVAYKNGGIWGGWTTLATVNVKGDNRGSAHANLRYTSTDATSWEEIKFRTYTGNSNCFAAALRVDCLNTEASANIAGSTGYRNGTGSAANPATSVLGASPSPPTWTRDPLWENDKYLVAP